MGPYDSQPNRTLNPKLRGVFFWGVREWNVDERSKSSPGVSPVVLWGDTWLARLVTQLVPSTVGFAPDVDWVEAVLWLSPKGARTGQQQKRGSWGNDGKMKSVKSMNIFNEWFFLLEPSFFLWECWRATPCKGKETVLLFGSRFIIVWGYQSNQRMRMSRGHHGISADSCIWSYWRRNACAFDKSCWKRYIYLFTTRCFDHNPSFFLPKKTRACAFVEKKRTTARWWALFHSLPGGCLRGFIRTAYWSEGPSGVPAFPIARCMAASGSCFSRQSTQSTSYRQTSRIAPRKVNGLGQRLWVHGAFLST